ncbi:Signal transduction histidine kinase [Reinekea sp. MED297]|uniref:histidine kinase n=1 Tax=Reinekea blandensis MED297 TaxID=314283 RepID=A4BJI8_9GAMM|nr:Signal transduction histidine kinase [Reinekea sp. MED297] [Reinekea blandensis MED297]
MVASIIVPAMVMGAIEITSRFQSTINERSRADAQALMEVLKEGLNPPLWSFIAENAEHLIDGVALNEAVNRITVLDTLDEIFVEYHRVGYQPEADAVVIEDDVLRDDRKIGSVLLEYSLEPAREQAWQDTREVLLITLTQVLVSLTVILLVLKWRVTDPLNRIKSFAHQVAAKNFNVEIHVGHDDEFADIAKELDTMRSALKESFDHLEDRVKERTEALTRVNQELTDTVITLEGAKDSLVQTEKLAALGSLVAGVSHELNTPIGNGRVMSTALYQTTLQLKTLFEQGKMSRSMFENALDEILQGTGLIERNLQKAINLVESFKNIAVDRTSDQRRRFYINEFLMEIESTLHHIFRSRPHELVIDLGDDVELNSFPGVLSQIISNLINNALMHGFDQQDHGTVIVRNRHSKDRLLIEIIDDGIGMSEPTLKRIFEPFFTTKMGKGGSGLGMHIVHNLVSGPLGGQLDVESELGKGTTVRIDIPLRAPIRDHEQSNPIPSG